MDVKRFVLLMFVATFILGLAIVPAGSDGGKRRKLRADLKGFNEVASVSTVARGSFRAVIRENDTEIKYRLRYSGLEGSVTQAHIHLGQRHTNGSVSVFLCTNLVPPMGVPTPPLCPPANPSGEVTGVLTAADVTGNAAGQGIAAGEFAELVRAIRAGATYVNVHSQKFPGGEIRGQIRSGDDDDDHRD